MTFSGINLTYYKSSRFYLYSPHSQNTFDTTGLYSLEYELKLNLQYPNP